MRRSGRVDDVGESGGIVDDLYMFDGIAEGSREALVGKVGFCGLGGRSAASPRPTIRSTDLSGGLARARS